MDKVGSVAAEASSTGTASRRARKDPYGNVIADAMKPFLPPDPAGANPDGTGRLAFAGHERDANWGLVDMHARMYSPRLGRFISPDPIVSEPFDRRAHNAFAYVWNTPTALVDPDGRFTEGGSGPPPIDGGSGPRGFDGGGPGFVPDTGSDPPRKTSRPTYITTITRPDNVAAAPTTSPNATRAVNSERRGSGSTESHGGVRLQAATFSRRDRHGYKYVLDHIIGMETPGDNKTVNHLTAMLALQLNPSLFFPFDVKAVDPKTNGIELGKIYNLQNKQGAFPALPPGKHPVKVTDLTATSFTFTAEKGHFDAPGSTIKFEIYADSGGYVHLQHTANAVGAEPSLQFWVAPTGARMAWDRQADNLSKLFVAEYGSLWGRPPSPRPELPPSPFR
jgi:RHS repeat-associated protein